jgi:hypothetical protein
LKRRRPEAERNTVSASEREKKKWALDLNDILVVKFS